MNSKTDLNDKFISFLDQTKNEEHKSVNHLNDRVLIVDGLNTFIRSFAVNPSINDDGLMVEPTYYIPIIPMVLINGMIGIGTGFSTKIPQYNPLDIIRNIVHKINNEQYIVILAGTGGGNNHGGDTLGFHTEHVASLKYGNNGRLLAFKIDGKKTLPRLDLVDRTIPEQPKITSTEFEISRGTELYGEYCAQYSP